MFPDQTKQTITVNMTYLVGSATENYGETGMAHLLEHMVFKGTPRHTNIPQELTAHGARPNGSTWSDRTNYFETFSASDENLNWALDLEADRMINSFVAKKDLDSEMTVVRNEYESSENLPFNVLLKRMLGSAYDWHNYSKDVLGARSDIENVPIERLQAFYRHYYQPDNAVLLIAGKFNPETALELVAGSFGTIPGGDQNEVAGTNSFAAGHRAKAVNFGIVYGISPFGLAANLSIPQAEAKLYIETYFARYVGVRQFIDRLLEETRTTQQVRTLFGRVRPIPSSPIPSHRCRPLSATRQ